LDSRCWTNDRNDTALNAIAFIRLQGRMLCESNIGGISLPTVGSRKFLVPVWQLHDIVPITSTVAPEEPATTRRPTIWTAAAARRCCRGDGTQLRGEWNWMVPRLVAGGICGLQTRVDKSRDYGETTRVSTTFPSSCCS
jgi:hypothetical protein